MDKMNQTWITYSLEEENRSQIVRLILNLVISAISSYILYRIMPKFREMFMSADLKGCDLSKRDKYEM